MRLDKKSENIFFVNNKKRFTKHKVDIQWIKISFNFAISMVFGSGYHRNHRTGGEHLRKNGELFANTFQGKLAEYITYIELKNRGIEDLKEPDTNIYKKGIWDDTDLEYKDIKINIKSASFFSNLLLLEVKDWNQKGEYIPNIKNSSCHYYDYFLLIRIKPDIKQIFKKANAFYADDIEEKKLFDLIFSQKWFFDFAGVCSNLTLKYIIENKYILPKNSFLNAKIKMDADNYYIQAGNLKDISWMTDELKKLN